MMKSDKMAKIEFFKVLVAPERRCPFGQIVILLLVGLMRQNIITPSEGLPDDSLSAVTLLFRPHLAKSNRSGLAEGFIMKKFPPVVLVHSDTGTSTLSVAHAWIFLR